MRWTVPVVESLMIHAAEGGYNCGCVTSAGAFHADARAQAGERTAAAPGGDRDAEILAERHQKVIELLPVAPGKPAAQCGLGFVRGPGRHIAPEVRDPVDVRVDADAVVAESDRDDQVGGPAP